jgi:hypothetical protein
MTEQQLQALAAAPKVVERLLRVFPSDRLDERLHTENFTPREVVALLADTEQLILDRIRLGNMRPGSTVPWYDPNDRAKEHHYSDKDAFHEAEVYESRRGMTLDYLRGLGEEDYKKSITLEGKGSYSLDQYLVLVMAHDLERIGQISEHLATEVATIS